MAIIMNLKRQEPAHLDVRALELMESILGPERCREIMEETSFDLVDTLAAVEAHLHEQDYAAVRKECIGIASMSAQIGLDDFSLTARNVVDCINADNMEALPSVAARMMRLGEASLMSVLNLTEDPYS